MVSGKRRKMNPTFCQYKWYDETIRERQDHGLNFLEGSATFRRTLMMMIINGKTRITYNTPLA